MRTLLLLKLVLLLLISLLFSSCVDNEKTKEHKATSCEDCVQNCEDCVSRKPQTVYNYFDSFDGIQLSNHYLKKIKIPYLETEINTVKRLLKPTIKYSKGFEINGKLVMLEIAQHNIPSEQNPSVIDLTSNGSPVIDLSQGSLDIFSRDTKNDSIYVITIHNEYYKRYEQKVDSLVRTALEQCDFEKDFKNSCLQNLGTILKVNFKDEPAKPNTLGGGVIPPQ